MKNINRFSLGVILVAIVLTIAGITLFIEQNRQRAAIDRQTSTTDNLIKEVKKLSEENKSLNQENRDYSYCTAQLIAKYTRDQEPITIEDLRTCELTSFSNQQEPIAENSTNVTTQSIQPSSVSATQTTRPASNTSTGSSTTNNTTNTTNNPAPSSAPVQNTTPQPSPILSVPNLLQLNTPCLNILGAVKTC